jgi:class 3 adenylate cyclase
MTVTVLMSDVRGYSTIAERADLSVLAGQLDEHRQEMNAAILGEGGTVMQYIGDAVMAVFGAPFPQDDHALRALRAAEAMHRRQADVNRRWEERGLDPFGLGIGLSTGEVAAALLGSDERLEYTVIGDTVNLAQRLQDLARPAGSTVVSDATLQAACATGATVDVDTLGAQLVKGRESPVVAHRLLAAGDLTGGARTPVDMEASG